MGYYGYGSECGYMGMGVWGSVFMIVFWLFVIVGIIALIQGNSWNGARHHLGKNSPLDILKERYAKGEINRKEFEEKKKGLE